jgi:hypothetical protein
MSREINTTQPYADKLVKLIPTEIVGAYMVLAVVLGDDPSGTAPAGAVPLVPPDSELKRILLRVVFMALLLLTPVYLRRIGRVSNFAQLAASTVSYIIWVYTLRGPFGPLDLYNPLIAAVLLVLWSLTIPLFVKATDDEVTRAAA